MLNAGGSINEIMLIDSNSSTDLQYLLSTSKSTQSPSNIANISNNMYSQISSYISTYLSTYLSPHLSIGLSNNHVTALNHDLSTYLSSYLMKNLSSNISTNVLIKARGIGKFGIYTNKIPKQVIILKGIEKNSDGIVDAMGDRCIDTYISPPSSLSPSLPAFKDILNITNINLSGLSNQLSTFLLHDVSKDINSIIQKIAANELDNRNYKRMHSHSHIHDNISSKAVHEDTHSTVDVSSHETKGSEKKYFSVEEVNTEVSGYLITFNITKSYDHDKSLDIKDIIVTW